MTKKQPEKRQVITTTKPSDPRKKRKSLTTHDLPADLENYHGKKEKSND